MQTSIVKLQMEAQRERSITNPGRQKASGPPGVLQRKCDCGNHTVAGFACEECEKNRHMPQRRAANQSEATEVPPIVDETLRSSGQPIDAPTRAFMELLFGREFSDVRAHTDAKAAESARAVNALAYTVGRDIVFGAAQYAPQSNEGRMLIAHELTHVIQQNGSHSTGKPLHVDAPNTSQEREADIAARSSIALSGSAAPSQTPAPSGALQRQPAPTGGNKTKQSPAPPIVVLPFSPGLDCSATSLDPFGKQPAPLRDVLEQSSKQGLLADEPAKWFEKLGQLRPVLTSIYNRMCQLGLWKRVRAVRYVAPGEKPFLGFDAPGSVGSVGFIADDGAGLMRDLLGGLRFCADTPLGGSQHKEQASFREISKYDGLHVAVGPGARFDAHIDKQSPAAGSDGGQCVYDPIAAATHIGRELVPPKVRKFIKVPGVQIFPEKTGPDVIPGAAAQGEPAQAPLVGITLSF